MIYCLCYGVKITRTRLHFFVLSEDASSKGSFHALCNYRSDIAKAADNAIVTDPLFKIRYRFPGEF